MKSFIFLLTAFVLVNCDHLLLGETQNKQLLHHETAQYNAIPFWRREKDVFYTSPDQKIINAVMVFDNANSNAKARVTAGGLGKSFVNIRMTSERGEGIDYDIGIYS